MIGDLTSLTGLVELCTRTRANVEHRDDHGGIARKATVVTDITGFILTNRSMVDRCGSGKLSNDLGGFVDSTTHLAIRLNVRVAIRAVGFPIRCHLEGLLNTSHSDGVNVVERPLNSLDAFLAQQAESVRAHEETRRQEDPQDGKNGGARHDHGVFCLR